MTLLTSLVGCDTKIGGTFPRVNVLLNHPVSVISVYGAFVPLLIGPTSQFAGLVCSLLCFFANAELLRLSFWHLLLRQHLEGILHAGLDLVHTLVEVSVLVWSGWILDVCAQCAVWLGEHNAWNVAPIWCKLRLYNHLIVIVLAMQGEEASRGFEEAERAGQE